MRLIGSTYSGTVQYCTEILSGVHRLWLDVSSMQQNDAISERVCRQVVGNTNVHDGK